MKTKFENHLFLGKAELDHFKESVQDRGYKLLMEQVVGTYGIVKTLQDTSFSALKAIQGSSITLLTVKAGTAIDLNMDVIDLETDAVDAITVPSDNVIRYLTIKYDLTTIEKGTIDISTSGQLTGTNTEFMKMLRGLPNFCSRITFTNSVGNTLEYDIASVTSDTQAQLNIAAGQLIAETGLQYQIVGTFTPGSNPSFPQKYPFQNDGYELNLNLTNTVVPGEEFLLASVQCNGITTQIIDLRSQNIFAISQGYSQLDTSNPLMGLEQLTYQNTNGPKDFNLLKLGWGLTSLAGQWSYNANTQQITITIASGGVWKDTSFMTNGVLDGWYVFVKNTGQRVKVTLSSLVASTIVLTMESVPSLVNTSDIVIVPDCTGVEFSVDATISKLGSGTFYFDVSDGHGTVPILAGALSNVKWRHIGSNGQTTQWYNVNSGNYYNEAQFNTLGQLIGGALYTAYTAGATITAVLNTLNHSVDKASRSQTNTFTGANTFNGITSIGGSLILSGNSTLLSTGTYNNVSAANESLFTYLMLSGAATITGFTSLGADGRILMIRHQSGSGGVITLAHMSGASSFGNQMSLLGGVDRKLQPEETVCLMFDGFNSIWIEILGNQSTPWIQDTSLSSTVVLDASIPTYSIDAVSRVYYKYTPILKEYLINGYLVINRPVATTIDQIIYMIPSSIPIELNMSINSTIFANPTGSHTSFSDRPAKNVTGSYVGGYAIVFIATGFDTSWTTPSSLKYILQFSGTIKTV